MDWWREYRYLKNCTILKMEFLTGSIFFNLTLKMELYSIGDSHSKFTFNGIPEVTNIHLGPVSMHRFSRDRIQLSKYIPIGCTVITSFGGADVRCHIHPQSFLRGDFTKETGRTRTKDSVRFVIDDLTDRYMTALKLNSGYDIVVLSMPPPERLELACINPFYPARGSNHERSEYTIMMNASLEEKSAKNNFRFLDVYTPFVDVQGMLSEHTEDFVHLANPGLVREAMKHIHL
jgi:hypothetical protein